MFVFSTHNFIQPAPWIVSFYQFPVLWNWEASDPIGADLTLNQQLRINVQEGIAAQVWRQEWKRKLGNIRFKRDIRNGKGPLVSLILDNYCFSLSNKKKKSLTMVNARSPESE